MKRSWTEGKESVSILCAIHSTSSAEPFYHPGCSAGEEWKDLNGNEVNEFGAIELRQKSMNKISETEKEEALQMASKLARIFVKHSNGELFYKVFLSFISKNHPKYKQQINDVDPINDENVVRKLTEIIKIMVVIAANEK